MSAPLRLGVIGHPLEHTLSPVLHRAGMRAIGLEAESSALPTTGPELAERLSALASGGYRGVNVTMPLKEAVVQFLDRVSEPARTARSVNTIGFAPDGSWGESTDGPGFVDLLRSLGRDPARERVLLRGGGGAARSLALALLAAGGSDVTVAVRHEERARAAWSGISRASIVGIGRQPPDGELEARPTLLVNCTPDDRDFASIACAPHRFGLAISLNYGLTLPDWVEQARARGIEAYDGLGLLVFQARRSLSLWAGREVPLEPLARAVGWPR